MHRLQLVFAAFFLVLSAAVVAVYLHLAPIQIVDEFDRELELATLGYNYRGQAFTGIVYHFLKPFSLERLTFIYKGKRHGADIAWFDNGQRSIERHYDHGLEVGEHKAWYQDGSVKYFKSFVEGVAHGEFFDWHSNGQLAQFILFDHGREVAAKSWTAGGKPFYNYLWDGNSRIGLQGDRFCSPKKR